MSMLLAEATAILEAIKQGIDVGWRNVIIESDCKKLVNILSIHLEPPCLISYIIIEARSFVLSFYCITFTFTFIHVTIISLPIA